MKQLNRLWCTIEDLPDLLALPAVWRTTCGEDFGLIETWLQPTPTLSAIYPCPYPKGHSCPRRIICHGDDEIAAICQDPHRICPDLSLSVRDVLLYDLDLSGFMNPVLQVAGIRNPQMESRSPGVWNVGLAVGGDLLVQPAYLLVFRGAEEFSNAALSLMFDVESAFTIIAPTGRHWTGTLRERMCPPRINFVSLDQRVCLDDAGRFAAVRQPPSAEDLKPTPVELRETLIGQFRRNNGDCAIKQMCHWAKVSREDLNKWKNGRPAVRDKSVKAIRIEKLLQFGIRS
jgi:hypothetical protein